MALQWMGGIDKGATLDEAQQLAMRHLGPAFAEVRDAYGAVGFKVADKATRLADLMKAGRDALAKQQSAQNRYELESEERRTESEKARQWFNKLHTAAAFARATKHPLGSRLPKLSFTGETDVESFRASMESVHRAVENLAVEPVDWKTVGLTASFLDEGRAVLAGMTGEWADAIEAESQRYVSTERLAGIIEEIIAIFEEIHAARAMAMVVTGRELPGLELSLVKAVKGGGGGGGSETAAPTSGGATGL